MANLAPCKFYLKNKDGKEVEYTYDQFRQHLLDVGLKTYFPDGIGRSKVEESRKPENIDEAVSILESLKIKEPKPKKKRLPSKRAIDKLDPETPSDFIALALANKFISIDSFNNANDRNNLKVEGKKFPSVRMNYLRKNGESLDQLVIDLANNKKSFPFEMTEDNIRRRIIGFMLDNPNGPNSYAVEMLNIPDPEQEYYDRQTAMIEQMLSEEKAEREAELDAIDTAWEQIENDIEALSEEDIDKILSLMAEDDIENINNIIESNNEKQDFRGKENESNVLSENESSRKDNEEEKESVTNTDKLISASSRFKPKELVVFDKPILGPNGNKLVSYQWAYEWTMLPNREGELVDKRVSDWTQAETSAETGRGLVHKFNIERKDGVLVTVSSETVPSLLGYVEPSQMKSFPSLVSSVKTLAKQRMQLSILKAQESEYNQIKSQLEKEKKPEITVAKLEDYPFVTKRMIENGRLNPNDFTYFKMGENIYKQDGSNKTPNKETIEQLNDSWIKSEVQKRGGVKPKGLYDLERKIERQEKRVSQISGSKTTIEQKPIEKENNQGKSREELEAKVKEKKSAVDKAQNALSKAKANLEKAVSESQRDIFGKAEAESKLFATDLKSLNKVISEKESILALAKESLQKANDELNSWTPKNQTKITFDDTISALESFKADTKGKMNAFGIIPAIWNAGVDTVILAIKAGKSISEAIQEGINYFKEKGAEFDEKEVTDFFNKLLSPKKSQPKEELPKNKTSKFYKTVFNNNSLGEANKVLTEDDFSYEVKSKKESVKAAKEYIERVGIEDAYDNFMRDKVNELELDERVALASLLTVIVNMGIQESINQNDIESREFFYENYRALMDKARNQFTKLGQAVNAIKLFLESMSSPELAEYKLRKSNQETNDKIKDKAAVKANASAKVNSGKKTVKEGIKATAEEVAKQLNEELYGVITKGKKGLSESQKKSVKNFFNNLKIDTKNAAFSSIIPISPKVYNDFIDAVGTLVAEGLSLSVAMTQVSTEFIKNKIATPDELVLARKTLSEEVNGLKQKKPLTEEQKKRNAAREELRKATAEYKEMETLAKELEKERARVEKLRKEEAKKQSERIDKATNELLAAERKEAENKAKELEKKIRQLEKDIVGGKALEDQVEDIINEYLKMGAMDNTANQALIDLVKERLEITDERKAVEIANKIAKSVVTNIREKLSKKWDADIKRQREKETKEKKTKDPHKEVNDFVKSVALGAVSADQFIELFGEKYGLETLTQEDFAKVRELAAKVRDADTPHRKNKAMSDMTEFINSKAPVTLAQLYEEMWYFKVLSSAIIPFLGTGDTNLTYNATQVFNMLVELPTQEFITTMLRNKAEVGKGKGAVAKARLKAINFITNVVLGYGKAVIQRNSLKNKETNVKTFLNVLREQGFFKDSVSYFREIMSEGSGAFKDFESPFKSGAKTEFEIRRWFKLAKEGDLAARNKIVAALYEAGNLGANLLNKSVNLVPRSLAAGDLFFSAIIKNAYLPALVREQLVKTTDLRGAALEEELNNILLNSDIEIENAKQKAVENRMRLDIDIRPKMIGNNIKFEIYDKDKLVKGVVFDTKEAATEYARREIAPKGPMYQIDVTDYLNVKVPYQAMQAANRLAGQVILGGTPPGRSGELLALFNKLSDNINEASKGMEELAGTIKLNTEESDWLEKNAAYIPILALKALAVTTNSLNRLFAFRRVGIMLARNYSNYTLIGFARAYMAKYNKSAFFKEYEEDQTPTEVERDKMIAQAMIGTITAVAGVASILALADFGSDDDDEKKRVNDIIMNIQPGTIVGQMKGIKNTGVISDEQFASYKASGDLQEYSMYLGKDKNGVKKWKSLKADPTYASALAAATIAWDRVINPKKSALVSVGLGATSFYNQFKDMGIGQGLPKLSSSKDFADFFEILAQTVLFDNLEITKVGLPVKIAQYIDRKKRLDPHYVDYIDENGVAQGTADYLINEVTPVYNLGDAVRQPVVYGALGEELYRVPAQEQGAVSAQIGYLDSDKNKGEKDMYRWLAANGYDKIFYPNVSDLKDENGEPIKLSIFEKNKLGMLAARASYQQLRKSKADLEVIRQTGGTQAFRAEVEKIFRSNFNDIVQVVKKSQLSEATELKREERKKEFQEKIKKLKLENKKLYGYDEKNIYGETIHREGLIDKIKGKIKADSSLVPFEELDTFGTTLKEATKDDRFNMLTKKIVKLQENYDKKSVMTYVKQLELLGYIGNDLVESTKSFIKKLEK